MVNRDVYEAAQKLFRDAYGRAPTVTAYAPGRVEVLGNHTDYNEGYVLSTAIDRGTFFLAAPAAGGACRLMAGDVRETESFDIASVRPSREHGWANYVKGVFAKLSARRAPAHGFDGLFLGNIPLGSGLSSSAALEISSGLALAALYGIEVPPLDLARMGQAAEHEFAGVRCGLLDQISSLFGRATQLVMSDFRTLQIERVPLGKDACFLMGNTHARHALVDGAYNERRLKCEEAARHFAAVLPHPVAALRDVSWAEWEAHRATMDATAAKRAAHVIGENTRVIEGRKLLRAGGLEAFGKLMFESHRSSREYFENSCPELDVLVEAAQRIPGVMGARLSGGGFGGSVVVLVHPRDAQVAGRALAAAYAAAFGHPCGTQVVIPSDGATLIPS